MNKVTEAEKEKYVDLYNKGWSTIKIGKKFQRAPGTIRRHLNNSGIVLRSNRVNSRKYYINNKCYFDSIDTEEKAYLLGFIYADGYITKQKGGENSDYYLKRLGVSILAQDKEILELLKRELDTSYDIYDYETTEGYSKCTKYSRLLISDNYLVESLEKQGVLFNKTNILKPPTNINVEYIRHFIRGYMDGDGSIVMNHNRDRLEFSVNIVGTDDILIWINRYFMEMDLVSKRGIRLEKRNENQTVSYCRWGGNLQVKKILDHIYEDSTCFLNRKHERYLKLCKMK